MRWGGSGVMLAAVFGLSACADDAAQWKGYALRDGPTRVETRLVGGYGSAQSCREGLRIAPSDPDSEALACGLGCAERDAEVYGCAATIVLRVPEERAPAPVASGG